MITARDSFKKRNEIPSEPCEEVFLRCLMTGITSLLSLG